MEANLGKSGAVEKITLAGRSGWIHRPGCTPRTWGAWATQRVLMNGATIMHSTPHALTATAAAPRPRRAVLLGVQFVGDLPRLGRTGMPLASTAIAAERIRSGTELVGGLMRLGARGHR